MFAVFFVGKLIFLKLTCFSRQLVYAFKASVFWSYGVIYIEIFKITVVGCDGMSLLVCSNFYVLDFINLFWFL